jgi:hypothetical protein
MDEYEGENVSMEENFDLVYPMYTKNHDDPGDWPEEFDGNTGQTFHLDTDSKTPNTDWFQSAIALPSALRSTLGSNLQGYVKVRVKHTDWSNGSANRTTDEGEITDPVMLSKAFELMNPNQEVTDMAATCLFSHMLDFIDADGSLIKRVGICETPELRDNHPGVLVDINYSGQTISRQGIIIPGTQALIDIVESNISR